MRTFSYPAVFEPVEEVRVIVVTFPDVPDAISQGDGEAEAREMGADALGVSLLGLLSLGRRLPSASKPPAGHITLSVDAGVAAKIAVIEAFQGAGINQAELARRLRKDGREIRRILDPDHATKVQSLQVAWRRWASVW